MDYSHWRANPRLVRAIVDLSADTIGWLQQAGVEGGRVAPMIIPDYTDPRVRERQLTANYVGTMR